MIKGPSTLAGALSAKHVAVFGASAAPGKFGYIVTDQLLQDEFRGEVTLVNPKGGEAFGLPLARDTAAEGADLAVIATRASTVPDLVRRCGELEIGTAIVFAGGFAEDGDTSGHDALSRAVEESGVRVIGPNCLGVLSDVNHMNLTTVDLPRGPVTYIGQSGGVGTQVARRLRALGTGFKYFFSLGNKVDVGFSECLECVAAGHGPVLLYLERFDEGERLLDAVADFGTRAPVVVLLGGRTAAGRAAARSHTGSMLANWQRTVGMLEDAGAVVVRDVGLAAAAVASSSMERRTVNEVMVLSDGGGSSVLLADALIDLGFELPPPSSRSRLALTEVVGERRSRGNPVEFAGRGDNHPAIYTRALKAALEDKGVEAVVLGGIFGGFGRLYGEHLAGEELAAAQAISDLAASSGCAIVVQTEFATTSSPALAILRERGIACVEWPEEAALALAGAVLRPRVAAFSPVPDSAGSEASDKLSDLTEAVVAVLDARSIPQALGQRVTREELPLDDPGPWVLRLDGFPHKVRVGALRLPLAEAELLDAYDELTTLAVSAGIAPHIRLHRVVDYTHEMLVSLWRSEALGDGWVVGAGGARVEQDADIYVGRLPGNAREVLDALRFTRAGAALLTDQSRAANFATVAMSIIESFRCDLPYLSELELNPIAIGNSAIVLDALPASEHAAQVPQALAG